MVLIFRRFQRMPVAIHRFLFFSLLTFVLVMSLIPGEADPSGFINDKVKHVLVFFMLTFVMEMLAYPSEKWGIRKPFWLMMFGVLIEVLQGQSGYRDFSLGDMVADGVGVVLFYAGLKSLQYFWIKKSEA
ncbi:VanZ family protein [Endozoicomonas elysicola]|uniref:VanZ family protein n=1 Tax=Endozoicomonas elysicola TaxID=305900 RepID=UPI00126960D4|nr:VanZ family protein [Endozoicomonas elysicola]